MGLDMFLYRYPKTKYSRATVFAAHEFVQYVCDDMPNMFNFWYDLYSECVPSMKTIYDLMQLFPDGNFIQNVSYWRKANAIHKWFVDNVQDGRDDCRYYRPVEKEDLEALAKLCNEVLDDHSKAEKLLPTMPGYCFGVYDYNDIYFDYVQETYELCKKLLEETDFDNYELYYKSSW